MALFILQFITSRLTIDQQAGSSTTDCLTVFLALPAIQFLQPIFLTTCFLTFFLTD
jgi:hypothetical protein